MFERTSCTTSVMPFIGTKTKKGYGINARRTARGCVYHNTGNLFIYLVKKTVVKIVIVCASVILLN